MKFFFVINKKSDVKNNFQRSIQRDPDSTTIHQLVWTRHVRNTFKSYIQTLAVLVPHNYVAMLIFSQTTTVPSNRVVRLEIVAMEKRSIIITLHYLDRINSLLEVVLILTLIFRRIYMFLTVHSMTNQMAFFAFKPHLVFRTLWIWVTKRKHDQHVKIVNRSLRRKLWEIDIKLKFVWNWDENEF